MNLDEAKQLYADRMFTRFLPMIPVPKTDGMTPEKAAEAIAQNEKIVALVRKSCWDTAHDLFEVLKLVSISVQVDEIAEQAAVIEGAVAASGGVTGSVQTSTDVELPLVGRTKKTSNSDGSYDIDTNYQGYIPTRTTNNVPVSGLASAKGVYGLIPGTYSLQVHANSPGNGWYFTWNGRQSNLYMAWPTNVSIDGIEAGLLTFSPGAIATAPNTVFADNVTVTLQKTSALGKISTSGSLQNGAANTTGTITEGTATLNKLVMKGVVKFHQAPVYVLTRETNNAGAQDLSIAKGAVEVRSGDYSFILVRELIWDQTYRYFWRWNGHDSEHFKLENWPKGIIVIDGGHAGVLTFTPSAEPPLSFNMVDRVVVTVANVEEDPNG